MTVRSGLVAHVVGVACHAGLTDGRVSPTMVGMTTPTAKRVTTRDLNAHLDHLGMPWYMRTEVYDMLNNYNAYDHDATAATTAILRVSLAHEFTGPVAS